MKDAIFAIPFPEPTPVRTPEWPGTDGKLFVRCLSAAERDRYESDCADKAPNPRARLVALATCDADGNRVFDDGDVEQVSGLQASVVHRLWQAAWDLTRGEGIEAAVKN